MVAAIATDYEVIIGLEVHAQLKTVSKIFCSCPNRFGSAANTQTCPVCLGYPGVLPVLNREAVTLALRVALATGCRVAPRSVFARKNYFYPDLPKGYQISQFDRPLAEDGVLNVVAGGEERRIRLRRIHMEEDAGKSLHEAGIANVPAGSSFVDLNRSGVPLIEIVTEPDLRSAEEAAAAMRELRRILLYTGSCDGNMEEGSMRCDANVSLRPRRQTEYGTRTELKNINSFKNVERAINFEVERQHALLDAGERIVQETRLFDADRGTTHTMRSKEEAHDYRYFPDPDLLPLAVDDAWMGAVRASLPELPAPRRARLTREFAIPLSDAVVLTEERARADYFEAAVAGHANPRAVANWMLSELLRLLKDGTAIGECPIPPESLAKLVAMIDSGAISGKIAKEVLEEMWSSGRNPAEIVGERGMMQITDRDALVAAVRATLDAYPGPAEQYRAGKRTTFGFLVGQVMKQTAGKANPSLVNEILKQELG